MSSRSIWIAILLGLTAGPPVYGWSRMALANDHAASAMQQLVHTRMSVEQLASLQAERPQDTAGSFGQADAVRLVNSALVEAGLSPSTANELALRDDPVGRNRSDASRLQRLTIRTKPLEALQLGRLLAELDRSLPSFILAEVSLARSDGLEESDTRYAVELALERGYQAEPGGRP